MPTSSNVSPHTTFFPVKSVPSAQGDKAPRRGKIAPVDSLTEGNLEIQFGDWLPTLS